MGKFVSVCGDLQISHSFSMGDSAGLTFPDHKIIIVMVKRNIANHTFKITGNIERNQIGPHG